MRKALLTGLTALFLLGSCAPANKCKDPKYVYKEGEYPEKIMLPKLPIKTTPRDFTIDIPESPNEITLSPYGISKQTYIAGVQDEIKEVEITMYPSMANKWIERIQTEEYKVLTSKYDIILRDEFEKGNLKPYNQPIGEDPSLIYLGPEEKRESVFKELGEIFPKASIRDGRFYPLSEDFPGSIPEANKIFNKGLEYILKD